MKGNMTTNGKTRHCSARAAIAALLVAGTATLCKALPVTVSTEVGTGFWMNNFTDKIYALGRGDAMQHLEKLSKSFFTQWGEKAFQGDTEMIEWISDIAFDEYCKGWTAGGGQP